MKKVYSKKGSIKKQHPVKGPPPKKVDTKKKNYNLAGLAIIILLGIIIYSNSFNCSFNFDDTNNIVDNLKIRNLSDVKAIWNFSPNRPFAVFTFALNYHFNQLDVRYWHLVNLVIHLINACLVWWLTLLIFSSPAMKDHKIAEHKKLLAFLTALLFVSHPLATQSVTYIVQRMTSLVAMFYLLSMSLYLKARLTDKGNTSKILLFAGSFISAMLAMLTKENAFTLPFAIVLVEFFFIRTRKLSINFKDYRVILLMAAFLGVILIIPLKYSLSIFQPITSAGSHEVDLTPFSYLLTQFSVVVKYIQLLFLPVNQQLDYNFPISHNFFEIRTLLSFLVLSSLIFLAVFLYKRNRIISFGISWFLLTLSIESSIIPIKDVIFEHRTYLPSFGFFVIISSGVYALFPEKYKYWAVAVLAILIGTNSYLTWQRNKVWKNSITLWSDNIAKAPGCARPFYNRGLAYVDLGQWDRAIDDFTSAIQVDPKHYLAWNNRAYVYRNLGQFDKALADYSRAISTNPEYELSWSNRGVTYFKTGQFEKAISDYTRAIQINPNFTDAYSNRSAAYGSLHQWDKALSDINKAIGLNPGYANAYSNRGNIYWGLKLPDRAISDFSRAIELNPGFIDGYTNRAAAFDELGRWQKAINDYTDAIKIDPNNSTLYYNRGLDYGKLEQWDRAISDYTSAINLNQRYKEAFVNRGVAYEKLGRWDKAIVDFEGALAIDPNFDIARINREIAISNLKSTKSQ